MVGTVWSNCQRSLSQRKKDHPAILRHFAAIGDQHVGLDDILVVDRLPAKATLSTMPADDIR
jgi:hypothetical protein